MTIDEITKFLEQRYPGQKVSFIGAGSDSVAFKVGTRVFRFSNRGRDIYKREAQICDAVRTNIDVPIPKISVFDEQGAFHVAHEMICGNKWSWHKFMWHPRRQRNLADSCARFLAQLHSVPVARLCHDVPLLGDAAPYIDFDDVADYFAEFLSPRQLAIFRRNYQRIISQPVQDSDMVLCHLGLKGVNSVVDANGNLCGVFDFCNAGVYERGRDLVLMSISRNRALYHRFLHSYRKYSGVDVSRDRIADLAVVEFLWRKRWYNDGRFFRQNARFVRNNLVSALGRFYGLPRWLNWILAIGMSLRARRRASALGNKSCFGCADLVI